MAANILIIEDNPANLELMCYLLQASGYTPLSAVDGQQGLEMIQAHRPDLILCDVQMPRLNGYQVAATLKADPALCEIPLIAITAFAMVGDREKIRSRGFDGYLAKPINPERFVSEVLEFLPHDQRIAASVPDWAPTFAAAGPASDQGVTVLVLDNMEVNLELMRWTLEPAGYRVLAANSIEKAMILAEREHIDLFVSDIHLDGESGHDFIEVLRARPTLRSIPFVFLSSTAASETDSAKALAAGATRFITRPIEPSELLGQIKACLSQRKAS
jgi:two-component system cell cycle response regulator